MANRKDQRWRLLLDFPDKEALLDFIQTLELPDDAKAHHADSLDLNKPCHQIVVTRDRHYGELTDDRDEEPVLDKLLREQQEMDAYIEHGFVNPEDAP